MLKKLSPKDRGKIVIECIEDESPWTPRVSVSVKYCDGHSEIVGDIATRDESGIVTAKLHDKYGRVTLVRVNIIDEDAALEPAEKGSRSRMPSRHGEIV